MVQDQDIFNDINNYLTTTLVEELKGTVLVISALVTLRRTACSKPLNHSLFNLPWFRADDDNIKFE